MEGLLKLGEAVRPALERLTQDAKGDTEAVTRAKAMLTKLDVAAEERDAHRDFAGIGIAVVRRAPGHDVDDVSAAPVQTDRRHHLVEAY